MFKVKNNIAPEIMKELSRPNINPYDLRNSNSFERKRENSDRYGIESVSYLGSKIWDLVPNEIKQSETLNAFKSRIRVLNKWGLYLHEKLVFNKEKSRFYYC